MVGFTEHGDREREPGGNKTKRASLAGPRWRKYGRQLAWDFAGAYRLSALFETCCGHPDRVPDEYLAVADQEGTRRAVCDFLAGMTDGYAIDLFTGRFVPKHFSVDS